MKITNVIIIGLISLSANLVAYSFCPCCVARTCSVNSSSVINVKFQLIRLAKPP